MKVSQPAIQVIQHLATQGFNLQEFTPNGKIHRFKIDHDDHKNSGYYVGFQNCFNGEYSYFVKYGSWKTITENTVKIESMSKQLDYLITIHMKVTE